MFFKYFDDLIIRPNPVTDRIIFLFKKIEETVEITFYTENGVLVHSESFQSNLDGPEEVTVFLPQDLLNGIYFFKAKTGNLEKGGKFFLME